MLYDVLQTAIRFEVKYAEFHCIMLLLWNRFFNRTFLFCFNGAQTNSRFTMRRW